jgi:alpha/beta hydrolase fold
MLATRIVGGPLLSELRGSSSSSPSSSSSSNPPSQLSSPPPLERRQRRRARPCHSTSNKNKPKHADDDAPQLLDQFFLHHLIMCYRCFFFAFITLPRMLVNAIRLLLFVLCLLPGFIQFAFYYWFVADRVSVRYAPQSMRQTLDVYRCSNPSSNTESSSPSPRQRLRPVVVFCPGGAWLIGYKMWGALTARALSASGIVVVVPDYRNYPWTTVPGMVHDVSMALQWTIDNIHQYDGDPRNIVVVGQSAGGHLAFTALLRQALGMRPNDDEDEGAAATEGSRSHHSRRLGEELEVISSVAVEDGDDNLVVVHPTSPSRSVPSSPSSSSSSSGSSASSLAGHPPPSTPDEIDDEEEEHTSATRALMDATGAAHDNSTSISIQPSPPPPSWTWEATDFKGLITLSAPFDLTAMSRSFQKHGLDKHIVDRIFGANVSAYDPRALLDGGGSTGFGFGGGSSDDDDDQGSALPVRLPPMRAYHGGADQTVPSCDDFCDVLRRRLDPNAALAFSYTIYPHWSHTDAIIEGPMMANHTFHRDVYDAVVQWTSAGPSAAAPSSATAEGGIGARPELEWPDDSNAALRPLCPKCLVQMGRFFMPF